MTEPPSEPQDTPPAGGGWGAPQQPPPPGYGAPPPGYGTPPGYGPPPGYGVPPGYATGTNQKAVWALVTGIVGLCCGLVGIVAIVLGQQAKSEIARSGQQGAGMAQAGFVLGIVDLALMVVYLAARPTFYT